MLPVAFRLRTSEDIRATIRHGVSVGRGAVVVHGNVRHDDEPARVAMAVSKAVGSAVVRNRVKRRMRGIVIEARETLPAATDLVLRARPSAAGRDYAMLRRDIDEAIAAVVARTTQNRTGH